MTLIVLRWLHLLFMTSWFGASLFVAGDVRRTLNTEGANTDLLKNRLKHAQFVTGASAWLTLLSGIALIVQLGGMAAVPTGVHLGLGMTVLMIGLHAVGIGGTIGQINTQLDEGAEPMSLMPLSYRLTVLHGVFHFMWVSTLAMMVFRHLQ